jgi:hypothetical protein
LSIDAILKPELFAREGKATAHIFVFRPKLFRLRQPADPRKWLAWRVVAHQ